uniref:holo-[acyl-carrier-protein] synthase n=1 Tax=Aureoumbra lagunensis TaxID=44058 RepID=A0A7S3JRA9_9STRA
MEETAGLRRVDSEEVVELGYSCRVRPKKEAQKIRREIPHEEEDENNDFLVPKSLELSVKFEIRANKALIRNGINLDSEEVAVLTKGNKITIQNNTMCISECGTTRLRVLEPWSGWISWKCGRAIEWEKYTQKTGRARWVLDLASWRPSLGETGQEWEFLVSLLPFSNERIRITSYARWLDRARALAARLLILKCCSLALGISDYSQLPIIERTRGGKPYSSLFYSSGSMQQVDAQRGRRRPPNFNFNISHDGRYVVLAAETYNIVGIDVAAPESLRRLVRVHSSSSGTTETKATSAHDLIQLGKACRHTIKKKSKHKEEDDNYWERLASSTLSQGEREFIEDHHHTCPYEQSRAERFRCIWACKEAITKARGDGLACPFKSIQLDLRHGQYDQGGLDDDDDDDDDHATPLENQQPLRTFYAAAIRINDKLLHGWRVEGKVLDSSHVVAVARAPVSAVIDADGGFLATLSQRFDNIHKNSDQPAFTVLDFSDLVPRAKLPIYHAVCAADQEQLELRRSKLKRTSISDTALDRSKNHNDFLQCRIQSILSPPLEEGESEPFFKTDDSFLENSKSQAMTSSQFDPARRVSSDSTAIICLHRGFSQQMHDKEKSNSPIRRSHSIPIDLKSTTTH